MAIAYDAVSESSGTFTTTASWTHTPVGTPRGVIVHIAQQGADPGVADEVSGVTYGGVAMTEVTGSPIVHAAGEDNAVYAYFLGASIPTGAQTVEVTCSASAGVKKAVAYTVTAGANTEVVDTTTIDEAAVTTNPSGTLSLGGRSCFCSQGGFSGRPDVGDVTPFTNWTSSVETDYGVSLAIFYKYDIIGTADVTFGWTASADEISLIAVAIAEVSGGAFTEDNTYSGVGTATLSKSVTFTNAETYTAVGTAVLATTLVFLVTKTFSGVGTSSAVVKAVGKVLSYAATGTVALTRAVSRAFSYAATGTLTASQSFISGAAGAVRRVFRRLGSFIARRRY